MVAEPVTLAELKAHCHEDLSDATNDTYMTNLITAAREWCESYTRRSIATQTWSYALESFPIQPYIYLPRGPVTNVQSIIYININSAFTTLASSNYIVTGDVESIVYLKPNTLWPSTDVAPYNVFVVYTAGYTTVPQSLKLAIMQLCAFWYEFRLGAVVNAVNNDPPNVIKRLLTPYRLTEFA